MRRLLLVAVLTAAVAAPVAGQRLGPAEERPKLRDVTDTNDANAYFDRGIASFDNDPEAAAAAFYWAARINPAWAEALYARRAALMMKDGGLRDQVYYGARKATPEMQRLDSLQFRAMMLNPFLFRRFDRDMFVTVIRESYIRRARLTNGAREPNPWEVNQLIEDYLRRGSYEIRGWMAYGASDFQTALNNYALALGSARNKSFVRMERGRIFGMRGQVDSAVAEFTQAVEEQQKKDEKQLVVLYDSKAMAEYSIGVLLEGAGNASAARDAFGRALQEDLAYYPAHMHLGLVALGQGDSTTAMSELALAAQIAPDEPYVQYVNGYVLASMKHYAEAEKSLRKAIELEPYYALPYLRLGQVYEQLVKAKEAHDAYKAFLDHASKSDVQRELATARLADVDSYLQAPGVAP